MIAVGAIFKNEYPYITEWIAYYKLLGFNKFYIVDNISDDGSSELLTKLHENGEITRIEYQTIEGTKPQIHAYNLILDKAQHECEYITFIDADEFLCFADSNQGIHDLIHFMNSKENIGGVALSWCMFGSSHAILPGNGLITERFDHRAEKSSNLNIYYKSFLKTNAIRRTKEGGIHHFPLNDGFKFVLTDGSEIKTTSGRSEYACWDICRLNHYVIKSNSEFYRKKMARGRPTGNNGDLNKYFFKNHDKNDVKDSFDSKILSKLKYEKRILDEKVGFQPSVTRHPPLYRRNDALKGRSHIDSITKKDSLLNIDGWCYYSGGDAVANICLIINKIEYIIPTTFIKKKRADVVSSGISDYEMCGFIATFDLSLIICATVQFLDIYAIDSSGDVIHDFNYENKADILKELFTKIAINA
ncbi:glycosyltransferase family 2 protein [Leclercia sp.]|uniref:glycosyltransferase family 2 protein n=1 Tax=Leclercia sp. TaxID=1898428 RepID=UPI00289F15BC|nr:glycosyltransferase family 2 protein [Leclercia sp.]